MISVGERRISPSVGGTRLVTEGMARQPEQGSLGRRGSPRASLRTRWRRPRLPQGSTTVNESGVDTVTVASVGIVEKRGSDG